MKKLIFIALLSFSFQLFGQSNLNNDLGSFLLDAQANGQAKIDKENFERRMQELRYEAALQAERDKLDKERQKRLEAERNAAVPPLPDLSEVPKWADIERGKKYKALAEPEKQALKAKYFDELIAPHAGDQAASLREQFMNNGLPWYELAIHRMMDYWAYGAIGVAVFIAFVFRGRVAVAGRYVVDNAFRVAALAAAFSLVAMAIRALQGPLFVFR